MPNDIRYWWQAIAALPLDNREHAYFALRRVWADQTINTATGARSFYRWQTEDHITLALWQNWRAFGTEALAPFLRAAGCDVGELKRVQWAYACEELTGEGRKFVTPDIMVVYEDEVGLGLLALEVKKPGIAAKAEDSCKLERYRSLQSARGITRRNGCFLVSRSAERSTVSATDGAFPAVSWESIREMQIEAAAQLPIDTDWKKMAVLRIKSAFHRYGIGDKVETVAQMHPLASPQSYEVIRAANLPPRVAAFLMGAECVEASWLGQTPTPPFAWLGAEPDAASVSAKGFQSTADRRVCRWRFDWHAMRELSAGWHG